MEKQLPISVYKARFCAYTRDERKKVRKDLWMLDFDDRHDFMYDTIFAGFAVEICFWNERYGLEPLRGVRHRMTLTLVDTTLRCEVSSGKVCVYIPKDEIDYYYYADFPLASVDLKAGHTYKYMVHDDTASATLGEYVLHLFGDHPKNTGDPSMWYHVESGGVRPAWESCLYKYLDTMDYENYYVRFTLSHGFGYNPPAILPELEMRLHYPDGKRVDCHFAEPICPCYDSGGYFVEQMFMAPGADKGVFYAELLCMGYLIAAFAFDTGGAEERGRWHGADIVPLDEYSPKAAEARFNLLTGRTDCRDDEATPAMDEFEEALNNFISDIPDAHDDAATDGDNGNDVEDESDCDMEDDAGSEPDDEAEDEGSAVERQTDAEETIMRSLERLTGLHAVKEKLRTYERVVRFNKMRTDSGLPVPSVPLHAMFLGSPGTGKTTVAKRVGLLLRRAGILSKGHVVVRERATLLGQNYNSEAEKTLAAIEEAQGGILFIDEAYQLYHPEDARDPGKFVIETLLTALAAPGKRDWMLILAGYPDEMRRMFDMNPGFKSRIPDSNIYCFEDFTECELMEIAEKYLARFHYTMTPDAHAALAGRIGADYAGRDRKFGNARHVINLIETEILPAMAVRVTNEECLTENSLTEIQVTDIPQSPPRSVASRPRVGFA